MGGVPMEQEAERKRGTFLVRILYRQNDSWQGEVLWAEQEEKRYFKSALELLKLMDDALDTLPGNAADWKL